MKTIHTLYLHLYGVRTDSGLAFPSRELADHYASLRCQAWGGNLAYLGAEEKGGLFYPEFNLFD